MIVLAIFGFLAIRVSFRGLLYTKGSDNGKAADLLGVICVVSFFIIVVVLVYEGQNTPSEKPKYEKIEEPLYRKT